MFLLYTEEYIPPIKSCFPSGGICSSLCWESALRPCHDAEFLCLSLDGKNSHKYYPKFPTQVNRISAAQNIQLHWFNFN